MSDDYRQRVAEAIAAKFTYPVYRCDRDGENERVENPGPADRIDQTPYVRVTAGDGCRSFWTPTCAELADAIVAVRDEPGTIAVSRADVRCIVEVAAAYLDMCEPPDPDTVAALARLRLPLGGDHA